MTRYMIVPNEGAVTLAAGIVGTRYTVESLAEVRANGGREVLTGEDCLLFPDAATADEMESLATGLALLCREVAVIRQPKSGALTLEAIAEAGWGWPKFRPWARSHKVVIPAPDGRTVELAKPDTELPSEVVAASGGGDLPKMALQKAPSHKRLPSTTSPDNAGSPEADSPIGLPGKQSLDAPSPGFHAPHDAALGEPAPLFENPPPEAYEEACSPAKPISAARAYNPYVSHVDASGAPDWPEPLDLTRALYWGLPMPLDLVPVPIQPFVKDNADRLGVGYGPVWFGVLGALAGLSDDFIRLQIKEKDDWTVHPVVWPLVIGGPSSGKSPAIEVAMKWVMKKDTEQVLENTRKFKDYEHQLKIYEDDCAAARKAKTARPQEPQTPTLREYWLNQGTREGAVRMLQYSPKLCLYMDEISGWLNSNDRYVPGGKGSGDREFWLSCFNGGPSKTSLAGRTVSVPNASVVPCGGSTPSAMRLAAGGKLQSDGLLARMLVCMVPDAKEEGTDTDPDTAAAAVYDRILTNLIDMQHAATVKLAPDALAIYRAFCADLTARIKSEDSGELAGALGKWYGVWGRVALIYFLADCAAHGQVPLDGDLIPAAITAQVTDFFAWQLTHQQQFWHEVMSDKKGRGFAQRIAKYILANPDLTTLNFRDHVARADWKALDALKPWEIQDAVNMLINAAWLNPIGDKRNTYGVPFAYDISPKIRGMFEARREQEIERRARDRDELQAMRDAAREPGED